MRHQRRYRKPSFRFPHIVNEETKEVFVYVVSGYPTVLAIPNLVSRNYPNYSHHLCSKGYFDKLVAEQKEKQLELLKTKPVQLSPFYKNKVSEYFNQISKQNND